MAVAHYLEALDWQREVIKVHAILGRQEPAPPELPGRRHGDAGRPRPAGVAERGHDRAGPRPDRRRRTTSSRASTSPTSWPSPRSTRTGRASGAASATTSSTATTPRTMGRTPPLFLPAGRDPQQGPDEGRAARSVADHRERAPLLVRVRGRRPGRAAPVPGRDEAEVHRAEAAVRSARHRRRSTPGSSRRAMTALPMEVGPLSRMLVAYASGHPRVKELVDARADEARASAPRRSSRRSAASRRAPSRRCVLAEKQGEWLDQLAANMGAPRPAHPRQLEVGPVHAGRPSASGAGLPRGAARRARATGCASRTARSRTTSASCRARGTPGRATRPARGARTRRRCSTRRSPTRQAGRDPAHHPLVRPVPGLRRPRARRRASARSRE